MNLPWNLGELKFLRSLRNPHGIQDYLDTLTFNPKIYTRSARFAMRDGTAHCFEGGLIAASALEVLGYPPLILDLRANDYDDDHILALFMRNGCYGAIAKSNCSGLRYREPIYRSIRELATSYFESYFNDDRERTLREFSVPLDLRKIRNIDWRTSEKDIFPLADRINALRHFRIISKAAERCLVKVDRLSFAASKIDRKNRREYSK